MSLGVLYASPSPATCLSAASEARCRGTSLQGESLVHKQCRAVSRPGSEGHLRTLYRGVRAQRGHRQEAPPTGFAAPSVAAGGLRCGSVALAGANRAGRVALRAVAAWWCCRSPRVLLPAIRRLIATNLLGVHAVALPLLPEFLRLITGLLHLLLARHDCLNHLIAEGRRRRLFHGENLIFWVVALRGDIEFTVASASLSVLRLRLPGGHCEYSHELKDVVDLRNVGAESHHRIE
eukprot:6214214-Pleurochrysis_carterae.AAC.2